MNKRVSLLLKIVKKRQRVHLTRLDRNAYAEVHKETQSTTKEVSHHALWDTKIVTFVGKPSEKSHNRNHNSHIPTIEKRFTTNLNEKTDNDTPF